MATSTGPIDGPIDAASIAAYLTSVSSQSNSDRPTSYNVLLAQILSTPRSVLPAPDLAACVGVYLDGAVFSDINTSGSGLVVGRQVLDDFTGAIQRAGKSSQPAKSAGQEDSVMTDASDSAAGDPQAPAIEDSDTQIDILEATVEKVTPVGISFQDQIATLRLALADLLEAGEDWTAAARALSGIPLESSHRTITNQYKLQIHVRIARLMLEGDDPVGADVHLKRATSIIHSVPGALRRVVRPTEEDEENASTQPAAPTADEAKLRAEAKVLGLQYTLCQARVYDSQRRFADAALRYHELSYVGEIDEDERTQMLSHAVTCAILTPPGPTRSRILSNLIRDERSASLTQHTILTKVFLQQIIRPAEIASFEELLAPHQRASLPVSSNEKALRAMVAKEDAARAGGDSEMSEGGAVGGGASVSQTAVSTRMGPSTVLDRAMMEHNVQSASRLYSNITLPGLGALLDLSPFGAEGLARRMIGAGRLKAEIDQVDGILFFLDDGSGATGEAAAHAGGLGVGGDTAGDATKTGAGAAGAANASASALPQGDLAALPDALEEEEPNDPHTAYTRRWDAQIARTSLLLEEVCQKLVKGGLLPVYFPGTTTAGEGAQGGASQQGEQVMVAAALPGVTPGVQDQAAAGMV